ncbi:hypothetical protein SAMN02745111_01091 [Eubacterium uniforme]|uniref:Histidine kinase-, DNA gyrase B-, and HSP90-like ATPase n=1 Tax=Eubacterium uniforme TaxID=39495 RepID=A0A1T4VKE7_9FIRM|nr:hypothetical protein [Eubacterium uniforme]SKA65406.1 hypothetical protein SAMN02745111_01091 [Eubacterium uniforme]
MNFTMNLTGQINQIKLPKSKALWPLFETIVNSIQSIEDTKNCFEPMVIIKAIRDLNGQINIDGDEEKTHFEEFIIIDNGEGFTERNYKSFLEAYSTYKVKKGCKGIGRFLWLKAFSKVEIKSVYIEDNIWYKREFSFSLKNSIEPENNKKQLSDLDEKKQITEIKLIGFKSEYRDEVALSLESLVKKIIEHCIPYFIIEGCPVITLEDNLGEKININQYYKEKYNDVLHQDKILIKNKEFILYHMMLESGADKHELHLCANNREVKSYDLSTKIPNLTKKIVSDNQSYYYVAYMSGGYLDDLVNTERYEFEFVDLPIVDTISEKEILEHAVEYIKSYLIDDLEKIKDDKQKRIDEFVKNKKPQYRYLLNQRDDVYDKIPVGLSDEKLDLELYKQEQEWELDIAKQKCKIEERKNTMDSYDYMELFNEYCSSITQLSQASLAEYIVRRKSVIELLEKSLEINVDGNYNKESQVHSIICPMKITSDNVRCEDMNLWLIDDRLAYHQFLASDIPMKKIPVIDRDSLKRMDIAIFNKAISFSSDIDNINSVTIVELKKPQRNDYDSDDNNPINQVLEYVADIKSGKMKKSNGRDFGYMNNVAFYCYVIADMTEKLVKDSENAGLIRTPDGEGFFGYNSSRGAYIEVISYNKLVKDAKKRNEVLFEKLFNPKSKDLLYFGKVDNN